MNIYAKRKIKIIFKIFLISLGICILLWGLLILTDYVSFKVNKTTIFSKTEVVDENNEHLIKERGLGYYIVTDTKGESKLYIFNKRIK